MQCFLLVTLPCDDRESNGESNFFFITTQNTLQKSINMKWRWMKRLHWSSGDEKGLNEWTHRNQDTTKRIIVGGSVGLKVN